MRIILSCFQYCDMNIRLFSIAPCKVFVKTLKARETKNYSNSDKYIGSDIEKKNYQMYKTKKKISKEIKSDNFCVR